MRLRELTHASPQQSGEVYRHFLKRRDVFPHIRRDYIDRMVASGHCIYDKGVIINYRRYRKNVRIGSVRIPCGSFVLHQILNTAQHNGAGHEVFERFCTEIISPAGGNLFLSVRSENRVAQKFYERNGMQCVGSVCWQRHDRRLGGLVYWKHIPDVPGKFAGKPICYCSRNDSVVADTTVNVTFDELLFMSEDQVTEWISHMRSRILGEWDHSGCPPFGGKAKAEIIKVFREAKHGS
jgi:hypothetical protein